MNKLIFFLLAVFLKINLPAQSMSGLEALIPMEFVNQNHDKVHKNVLGIGAYVIINLTADLNDTEACHKESVTSNGIDASFTWYNKNEEGGKMMLDMQEQMGGIQQEMEGFRLKNEPGMGEVKEENVKDGKLWIVSNHKACINEISGPTGVTEYKTEARCFVFNGSTMMKIKVNCKCKPEMAKEIMAKIIAKGGSFNFSAYATTTSSE